MKISHAVLLLPIALDVAFLRDFSDSFVLNDTGNQAEHLRSDLNRCDWLKQCYCRDESKYTNGSYQLLVNCTNAGLSEVPKNIPPNTTVLTLNGNNLAYLRPGAFKSLTRLKYLDLSVNNITHLYDNTFEGLGNLTTLELNQNKIRYSNRSIPVVVFKPLISLRRLNLQQNFSSDDVEDDEMYPTEALSYQSGLEELLLDGLKDRSFPEEFSNMKHLRSLEFNGNNGRCSINQVTFSMFRFCKNIISLKLIKCNIQTVQFGSFIELRNLTFFDISFNEGLLLRSLPNIAFGLQYQNLTELRLTNIHRNIGECVTLDVEHIKFMKNMTINTLFMDYNRLASLTSDAVDYLPRNMRGLSLKGNMILVGLYLFKIFYTGVFSNLIYINLSEQNINTDLIEAFRNDSVQSKPKQETVAIQRGSTRFEDTLRKNQTKLNSRLISEEQRSCNNCDPHSFPFRLSPSLKDIDLSDMRIRLELSGICICEPNSILRLNLERNIFWSWQGPFKGLSGLLNLNLAWNSCEKMSKNALHEMSSLMSLNLSRNFLDSILRNDPEGEIFKYQSKLQSLDLSDNKLRSLPPKIFEGLTDLVKLFLSNNFLTTFDVDLSQMTGLLYLGLSNNLLITLSPVTMETLEKTSKANAFKMYIDLSNNNLSCTCKDIDFIERFSKTDINFVNNKEYGCKFENGSILKLFYANSIYSQLQKDCADFTIVILVSSLSLFLFFVVFIIAIIYRYRWDLRYFYYSAKLRYQGYMPIADNDDGAAFEHDVFVSYCDTNGRFVKDVLVPELENKRGMNLLVHDRDFIAGHFVNDNIMRAVIDSRKTLIIMSPDFLKSNWCIFEMNMARMEAMKTGRNILCVLMFEHVQTSGLPPEIMDIIRQQTYLERPENRDHEGLFWDRVHEALKT